MRRAAVLLFLAALAGCDDGGDAADDPTDALLELDREVDPDAGPDPDAATPDPDAAAPDPDAALEPDALPVDYAIPAAPPLPDRPACDDSQPPVVMSHGLLASGDTWAAHVARFAANGLCADRYHAFDWNTLAMDADHPALLDAFIDGVLAEHGAEQVDLFGHSAGGRLGYDYLAEPARAAKVRRYVHIGSFPSEGPPGPPDALVPTLNVWSDADLIVEGAVIPGAEDAMLPGIDHYAVATDAAAFERVYAFLYDAPPDTTARPPADTPIVGGKVVSLGENQIERGATVDLWPLDPATGQRAADTPVGRWVVGEDASWGPFAAQRDVPYELHVRPAGGGLPVRYYRPPFAGDDPLVYLRTLPSPGSLAGLLLTQVPFDDRHTVLVVFSSTRAITAAADDLRIDGESVLTEAIASAEETLIALFVYDHGTDGEPGGTNVLFGQFPFLEMLDVPLAADPQASVEVRLGDQVVRMPRWPSGAEGAAIAVFDPTAE